MHSRLRAIPNLHISENVPLASYTRFEIGGPARLLADASTEHALVEALRVVREHGWLHAVIGGGTNLVVSDEGFPGIVVRYSAAAIGIDGSVVHVQAGAALQELVDATMTWGLRGLETMTGIPGWVGGAVYGNAGAYGHSIAERVEMVRFFDGNGFREVGNAGCEFRYRESIFKQHKDWTILSAALGLDRANPAELRSTAEGILKIRNRKYPPTMRCAGSIFKNLLFAELPEALREQIPEGLVREGKVPSAYFLEQVGAKGMSNGQVRVADYHANLIYNADGGTARQVHDLIETLKQRVLDRFGLRLEEEIQYV
jgi:UDP-N-acetylmuramate dehydrogenase